MHELAMASEEGSLHLRGEALGSLGTVFQPLVFAWFASFAVISNCGVWVEGNLVMLIRPSRNSGFTLAEVVVLLAIVVLLLTLAVPNYVRERRTVQREACIEQLRQIGAAKDRWATENHKSAGAAVTASDLVKYLKHGQMPVCPAGGEYTINPVGTAPSCSLGARLGHKL
jgi:competence protein ComGC